MKLAYSHRTAGRTAFTLIELLVVMAIIAILISLTAAAVFRFAWKGYEIQDRNDISQLSDAVGAFKTKFGAIPPSRVKLCFLSSQYTLTNQLDADSYQFMKHMFPRIEPTWGTSGIPWLQAWNSANAGNPPQPMTLEGEQCLVFFLGGKQTTVNGVNGCLGYSTNPNNPMGGGADTINPFFDFKSNRLLGDAATPFMYANPYGKTVANAYAYFSSYKTRNGYNRYYNAQNNPNSDCASLGVWPYLDPVGNYHNPETFQIISSGVDKQFGQGTNLTITPTPPTWAPGMSSSGALYLSGSNTVKAGLDDMSNFSDKLLGF
jgi:prepilin-type N-terminal cleavage/methylation domain-containing protein